MKIIDKTPLQDEKGEISFTARIQGTLKYGFSWYDDLHAQKNVIAVLNQTLDKNYTLIRNFTLPGSDIVIPIILIGPMGILVIFITHVKGFFEAKGDQWNEVADGRSKPSSINLLTRVVRLARSTEKYMQVQHIEFPGTVEPVLLAADPGAHIDSMRPAARVVQSDAIKLFASSLAQARPLIRPEQVYDLADRIVNPRPREAKAPPPPPVPASAPVKSQPFASDDLASLRQDDTGFNPADLAFSFDDEPAPAAASTAAPPFSEPTPQRMPTRPATSQKRKIMGMSVPQLAVIAGITIAELCIVAIGFYIIVLSR